MPLKFNPFDCSPLVIDHEIEVINETLLAEQIGYIILGHYKHVQRILDSKNPINPSPPNKAIERAIETIKTTSIEKRDGWIFQIMSWLALYKENIGLKFYCQPPHDAPAQHGIDGLAVLLGSTNKIESIIITEDKCSEYPRNLINAQIWPEFTNYEAGEYDNKIVNRTTAMLDNIKDDKLKISLNDDIYRKDIRRYRVGINRDSKYNKVDDRKKLFKDYDVCVPGPDQNRRRGATFYKEDIRSWMQNMADIIINFLESKKV